MMTLSTHRMVWFSLSKVLVDSQCWAVESFPHIIQRATGYSERWAMVAQATDEETGACTWQYDVEGIPDIDKVVDHIIHELTDAVILSEWHTVAEDRFTFGSMRRDKPEQARSDPAHEEYQA